MSKKRLMYRIAYDGTNNHTEDADNEKTLVMSLGIMSGGHLVVDATDPITGKTVSLLAITDWGTIHRFREIPDEFDIITDGRGALSVDN